MILRVQSTQQLHRWESVWWAANRGSSQGSYMPYKCRMSPNTRRDLPPRGTVTSTKNTFGSSTVYQIAHSTVELCCAQLGSSRIMKRAVPPVRCVWMIRCGWLLCELSTWVVHFTLLERV